jgi:hypothetical protein
MNKVVPHMMDNLEIVVLVSVSNVRVSGEVTGGVINIQMKLCQISSTQCALAR